MKVVNGQLQVFGMDVPKALVIASLVAIAQIYSGDVQGAVNTILIGLGIQKGGDSLSSLGSIVKRIIK